jgi:hypothetical protein
MCEWNAPCSTARREDSAMALRLFGITLFTAFAFTLGGCASDESSDDSEDEIGAEDSGKVIATSQSDLLLYQGFNTAFDQGHSSCVTSDDVTVQVGDVGVDVRITHVKSREDLARELGFETDLAFKLPKTGVDARAQVMNSFKRSASTTTLLVRVGGKKLAEQLLWRTELFLDKYNPGAAGETMKDAIKVAPKDPDVRVWFARLKLENGLDFDGAEAEINQALEVNPGHPGAYFVRAGLALRDMDITAADAAADAGLKTNPNDLELLSMKAAIRLAVQMVKSK